MPRPRKTKSEPKQGPPVTFRPGPELDQLVGEYAAVCQARPNEVYKELAALAAVGLDGRYYELLAHMARATKGRNAFVRATLSIHTALKTVARMSPAQLAEGVRARLVVGMVEQEVARSGCPLPAGVTQTLYVRLGLVPATSADSRPDAPEWTATEYDEGEEPPKIHIGIGE